MKSRIQQLEDRKKELTLEFEDLQLKTRNVLTELNFLSIEIDKEHNKLKSEI